ncbi:hypothetical protein [Streptomyces sp. NBC_01408]|uniref:hypothetical protein n=1 Tax=Streptomyces sp. NBC_01408 TaxID=2903855 RepID=UPI00224E1CEA|nr:hypothetical protein [Streptomyces sp. NBC_01408]MCX4693088.1 hypothetical protein [Streptomyces sp. NBC_01408]
MAQAAAQSKAAAALRVEYDTLKDYKILVDELLTKLEKSPADHGKLADGTLPAGALGKGFPEADALYKSYNTVHSELQKLAKGLAGQIEGLGIAILSAGNGYAGVDEETKRRMVAIAKEAKEHYVRDRDPYAEKPDSQQGNGAKGGVV